MSSPWIDRTRQELLDLRQGRSGWGYRPDGEPYVEPTTLAALALAATADDGVHFADEPAIAGAAAWLAGLQQPDGALGISAALRTPQWPTPLAVLLWQATGRHDSHCSAAVQWLLVHQGDTHHITAGTPFAHDPRIPGWPWVLGTQSWLEPTALAVLALRRAGLAEHTRTRDGQRLIRDRAIRSGGWNYGNSMVFGADLRPQPAPTGLALLALAHGDDPDAVHIRKGCEYLERVLPTTRAAQSLAWGLLALDAWGKKPAAAATWLSAARDAAATRTDAVLQLAFVLLAAGSRSLEFLGIANMLQPVAQRT